MKYYENDNNGVNFDFDNFDNVDHYKPKFVQKAQDKLQKVADKLGAAADKVKDKLKDGDILALYLPLVPLKFAMKKTLDKKGIPHSNNIKEIAHKFVEAITAKGNFDHLTDAEKKAAGDVLKENKMELAKAGALAAAGDPAAIGTFIKVILQYFKKAKENADKGTATDEEKDLAGDADKSIDSTKDMTAEDLAQMTGGTTGTPAKTDEAKTDAKKAGTNYMLIAVAVLAVILLAKK
jgi:hypothetical protein